MSLNFYATALIIAATSSTAEALFLGAHASPTECRDNRTFDVILNQDDTCIAVLDGYYDYTYYAIPTEMVSGQ